MGNRDTHSSSQENDNKRVNKILHIGVFFLLLKNTRKGKYQRVVIYNGKGFYDDYKINKASIQQNGKTEIELKEKHGCRGSQAVVSI